MKMLKACHSQHHGGENLLYPFYNYSSRTSNPTKVSLLNTVAA